MLKRNKGRFCAVATMALGLSVTGCFFGDSILSAGAKLASGQISQLTPGEIKILNETVIGVLAAENPGFTPEPLTDAQAEALSNFFQANELNTFEDIETLATTAETNPDALQGLDELAAAFEGSGVDTQNLDLDQILNALFGGSTGGGTGGVGGTGGTGGTL